MSGLIGISPDMRSGIVGGYHSGATIQSSLLSYPRTEHWWTQTATYFMIGGAGSGTSGAVGTPMQLPSFTPRSANSRILLTASVFLHTQQNAPIGIFKFYKDGSALSPALGREGIGVDTTPNGYWQGNFSWHEENPGTSARVYQFYAARYSGTGSNRVYVHDGGMNNLWAIEVEK